MAYAVGEVVGPARSDGEEEEERGERWRPSTGDCYEVVTAWVHPK